jgi:hypothetical protein
MNLWKATGGATVPASMMVARQKQLHIPPHQDYTISEDCNFTPSDIDWPISILGMTGHFHSLGKKFTVDKMRAIVDVKGTRVGDTLIQANIYHNATWSEPPFTSYNPPIQLNKGEFLRYTAEYFNNTDAVVLFGPRVKSQEHCNLFTWFVPAWHNGQTLYDDSN